MREQRLTGQYLRGRVDRRTFLRWSAAATAASVLAAGGEVAPAAAGPSTPNPFAGLRAARRFEALEEATIADLQAAMTNGRLTARDLALQYVERIAALDIAGPTLRSVVELNPDLLAIADALDAERQAGKTRGPLHGIPILLKDNIDTGDKMLTTAGSLALVGTRPTRDATVAKQLRDAGAVILGKANLSEWANFRSIHSSSGWSGRGRQNKNPYVLTHNPCGSSSGSAVAVAANLCAASLATETDGSIVCPAHQNGIVGIKPTVGLTSRAGVIPIAHSQDTVGPHARTVADAAAVLGALVGVDPRDADTQGSAGKFHTDYTRFLDPRGLRGARIGVARQGVTGYSEETDRVFEAAVDALRRLGATVVDPADIPSLDEMGGPEFEVLLYEFKADLNAYLATRVKNERHPDAPVRRTLAEVISFNESNARDEMPYFGQEIFYMAQEKGPLTEQPYLDALAAARSLGREQGIDAVLQQHALDAIVAPTGQPAWPIDLLNGDHFLGASSTPAAIAGYPLVTVPAGFVHGLPVGLTFMGTAYSEPALIKFAYAFEQGTKLRRPPRYLPTLDLP